MSQSNPDPDNPTIEYPRTAVAEETGVSETVPSRVELDARGSDLPIQIGKYRIVECLGRGGQGQVFRALHPSLGRDVVIKWASENLSAFALQQFLAEGRALARLDDPGVVRVHDVDMFRGRPFLVFEYVCGQSLSACLKRRRPTLREAVSLAARVAAIVERVHGQGILHRDLKPANILIDARHRPRLLDFGLAVLSEPRTGELAPQDRVAGTLAYMAPEQANGQVQRIGPRTDVFGLGALLFEMLTGQPPHRSTDQAAQWEKVRTGRVPSPRSLNPHIPKRLEQICLKALAFEPEERFASADQFRRTLRRYLLRPWLIAAVCVYAGLFLLGLAILLLHPFGSSDPPAPPPALAQERPAPPEPPPGWKVYRSQPGRFSVWLPGIPSESTSKVQTQSGEKQMNEATLNDSRSRLFFRVVHGDFLGKTFEKGQAPLDGARDGAVRNVQGKLLEERSLSFAEHPGRELLIEIPKMKGARIRLRMYLVEQRLYQLLVGGAAESVSGKEAYQFLDSFRLLSDKP